MPAPLKRIGKKRRSAQSPNQATRVHDFIQGNTWLLLLVGLLIMAVTAFVVLTIHFEQAGEKKSWPEILFTAARLMIGHRSAAGDQPTSFSFEIARFLLQMLFMIATTSVVVGIFREKWYDFRLWRHAGGHVVICGLGDKGFNFAKAFQEQGDTIFAIDKKRDHDLLQQCHDRGILVIAGDATDRKTLQKARVRSAARIVCVCPDDGINAQIGLHAREIVKNTNDSSHLFGRVGQDSQVLCQVHIFSAHLCMDLTRRVHALEPFKGFRLEFFNIFKNGAWAMLREFPPAPVRIEDRGLLPHVVIVGLGWVGQSVLLQACVDLYRFVPQGTRPRLTIVDRKASALLEALLVRGPHLAPRFEIVPLNYEIDSKEFQEARFLNAGVDGQQDACVSAIYVCLNDPSLALTAALALNRRIPPSAPTEIRTVIRLDTREGLGELFAQGQAQRTQAPIFAFGLLERTCRPELLDKETIEVIAKHCHEVWLQEELNNGARVGSRASMNPWPDLLGHLKESNRDAARYMCRLLDESGFCAEPTTDGRLINPKFSREEVEVMAEKEHNRWCREKRSEGYAFGPQDDDEKKTRCCLLPWAKLSDEQKDNARMSVGKWPRTLARVGLQITRMQ